MCVSRKLLASAFGLCLIAISAVAQSNQLVIIDHLLNESKYSRARGTNKVDIIMLHFSSDASANPTHPYDIERVIGTLTNATASANYIIDREGNVYRLINENRAAFHAGKGQLPWPPYRTNLNSTSIGIEMLNVSTREDMKIFFSKAKYDQIAKSDIGYTDAQYKSLNLLLADIRHRHPEILFDRHHIVGHSDYAPKRRTDPGVQFDYTRIGLPATAPKLEPQAPAPEPAPPAVSK
jgi:N-acetyl-anhydromuramyl-L-alanine amidase AmpD